MPLPRGHAAALDECDGHCRQPVARTPKRHCPYIGAPCPRHRTRTPERLSCHRAERIVEELHRMPTADCALYHKTEKRKARGHPLRGDPSRLQLPRPFASVAKGGSSSDPMFSVRLHKLTCSARVASTVQTAGPRSGAIANMHPRSPSARGRGDWRYTSLVRSSSRWRRSPSVFDLNAPLVSSRTAIVSSTAV